MLLVRTATVLVAVLYNKQINSQDGCLFAPGGRRNQEKIIIT
ncbi:unnamed protein product, partial [marine sediment metagenome]